jgi:hypothetical protein
MLFKVPFTSKYCLVSISPTFYKRICASILAPKKYKPEMQAQKAASEIFVQEKQHVICW